MATPKLCSYQDLAVSPKEQHSLTRFGQYAQYLTGSLEGEVHASLNCNPEKAAQKG